MTMIFCKLTNDARRGPLLFTLASALELQLKGLFCLRHLVLLSRCVHDWLPPVAFCFFGGSALEGQDCQFCEETPRGIQGEYSSVRRLPIWFGLACESRAVYTGVCAR